MTAAGRWGAGLAGIALVLALCSGCAPGEDGTVVDVEAQSPTTENAAGSTTTSEAAPTSALSVETTATTGEDESTTGDDTDGSMPRDGCDIGPVPASAGLDPFYTQGCQIDGFWIVAGDVVAPEAIVRAAETVDRIFASDERLAPTLAATGIRLGVIGRTQRTTEMPEYRDLDEAFPDTDWDARARGLGATLERPLVSAGEENILCLPDDRYLGEDILVHEFSHVLHQFGYSILDPDFDADLLDAYRQAVDDGTWDDTYAATDHHEYWAEGVQSYLGRNLTAEPADGVHGPIDTKAELEAADPALHALIDRRLGTVELTPQCG